MVIHRQKIPFFASKEGEKLEEPIIKEKKYEMRVLFNEIEEKDKWISDKNSDFLLLLSSNGFTVNKLEKGPITYNVIKNFDIFVIGSNRSGTMNISSGEFRAISQFVSDGRGLLFVGNEYINNDDAYNNYLKQVFGLYFKSSVNDEKNNAYPSGGWSDTPLINIFVEHPITDGVDEIYIQHNGSIGIDLNKSAEPLAFSTHESKPACVPVLAIKDHGKGKIAFIGSEGIFSDDKRAGISIKDNSKLLLNLFKWFPTWVMCPNCEFMNPPGEKYCSRCRTVLE
ncbi:MAG: zinc ribbon domain-containing protein [Promethearchaeota archaeon]|nr:MAG: zinc ribbon domain-containing protein [Candidatus Lokiarchaeota archaeon]